MTAAGSAPPQPAGSAVAFSPADALSAMAHDGKSGWRTTEFWVAVTSWLLPILTLVFHRNLSSLAVPLSAVAAGAANAAYSVSRAITKNGHVKAVATMVNTGAAASATAAGPAAAGPAAAGPAMAGPAMAAEPGGRAGSASGLSGADAAELVQAMTAALQALTAAVARLPIQPASGLVTPSPVTPSPAAQSPAAQSPAGQSPAGLTQTAIAPTVVAPTLNRRADGAVTAPEP